jgi:hypothetical protein
VADGSDTNTGLSSTPGAGGPWKTIAKVNAASFSPGDSILFKKGETWREELDFASSGSAGNPITISSYGSGAKPQVFGSTDPSSWTSESYTPSTPTPTKVQGTYHTGNASGPAVDRTFGATPTQGNLLIVVGQGTNAIGNASLSGSGWSLANSVLQGTTSTLAMWYKIAGAGEPTTITLTWTSSTSTHIAISEWNNIDPAPLDKTAGTATTGAGVTSRSSGTTATTTVATELAYAAFGMGNTVSAESYSNSFTEDFNQASFLFGATKVVTSTGAVETTESWTTSRVAGGIVATFKGIPPAARSLYYATGLSAPSGSAGINNVWFVANSTGAITWGVKNSSKDDLTAEYNFWWDAGNSRLYVFAATDPSTRYASVEVATRAHALTWNRSSSQSYIVIDGFETAFNSGTSVTLNADSQIKNNYIHHVGVNDSNNSVGAELNGGSNGIISGNLIHDIYNNGILAVSGTYTPYLVQNAIVEHNEVYDCFNILIELRTNTPSTGAVDAAIIRYNNLYHTISFEPTGSAMAGIYLDGYSSASITSPLIHNNLINVKKAGITISQYTADALIYNNSILSAEGIGISISGVTGVSGIVIKNNLVVNAAIAALKVVDKTTVAAADYNLWYTTATNYANVNATDYTSSGFAAYKSATGWDAHGLWQNPLVRSVSDFHLQIGSPCINKGVSVALTADYQGHSVPQEGTPDIGSYELPARGSLIKEPFPSPMRGVFG